MPAVNMETQESRTERIGLAVTPDEKTAVEFVARARASNVSQVLRELSLNEAVKAYRDLKNELAA